MLKTKEKSYFKMSRFKAPLLYKEVDFLLAWGVEKQPHKLYLILNFYKVFPLQ